MWWVSARDAPRDIAIVPALERGSDRRPRDRQRRQQVSKKGYFGCVIWRLHKAPRGAIPKEAEQQNWFCLDKFHSLPYPHPKLWRGKF